MHAMFRKIVAASLCLSLLTFAASNSSLVGQEKAPKAKAGAKAKGRLPAYYKDVVTEQQRQQIYAAQAKFTAQIDALEEQIKTLTAQRDSEIEAILTAEQKSKVEQLRANAAGKKKNKGDAEEAAGK